ncbi:hypothetical protein DPMN_141805 [Dreissena polymorpha]|uniref:Uncharacterized protein n=1 Tax=Dreissena polymorpha TaxID=45954 RepID=A0A9D4JIM7_DREPO|nr:hypothetical protein DPMN_141805 [Dreissena polymorpha]
MGLWPLRKSAHFLKEAYVQHKLQTYSEFWKAMTPISCNTNGSRLAIDSACLKNFSASLGLLVRPYSRPMYRAGRWHL